MRKNKIEKGKWYYIDYPGEFQGAAKCVELSDNGICGKEGFSFFSPLNESGWMCFKACDIKEECEPLPSYQKLQKLYKQAKNIIRIDYV